MREYNELPQYRQRLLDLLCQMSNKELAIYNAFLADTKNTSLMTQYFVDAAQYILDKRQ